METDEEMEELSNQPSTSYERDSDSGKSYLLLSGSHDNYFKAENATNSVTCDEFGNVCVNSDVKKGETSALHVSSDKPNEAQSDELIKKFLKGDIDFAQYAQLSGDILEESGDEETPKAELVETFQSNAVVSEVPVKKKPEVKKTKKASTRRNTKLPQHLKGLIGEANVSYARGDKQAAIDMCLEVIRQHPQASEAFFTLSHIYEDSGESDKALQMSLIGAHLNPSDKEIWLQLAEKSEKIGNLRQAIGCYTQALKKDWSPELLNKRGELQLQIGDKKSYFRGLVKMVEIARSKNLLDQELEASEKLAQYYFREEKNTENAKNALEAAFQNCSKIVSNAHINLYLELLILSKEFIKCLEVLVEHCGLEFVADIDDKTDTLSVVSITIPSEMVVDILAKLIMALILLKNYHLFDQIFPYILKVDPIEFGDLYLDIAETLMAENLHTDALKFLNPLTEVDKYDQPEVWVRKAECFSALKRYKEAVNAYEIVLEKAPLHSDARLALVDLLTEMGEREDAIKVLSFNFDQAEIDLKLTYEKCSLLKGDKSKEDEFISLAQLILFRHFSKIRNLDEKAAIAQLKSSKHRLEAILKIRKLRNESLLDDDEDSPVFKESDTPTFQQEYELFIDLCNLFIKNKTYYALQRLTFSSMLSKKFLNFPDLTLFAFTGCFFRQDGVLGFDFGRTLLVETNYENSKVWNLLSILFDYLDHSRVYKYLIRLANKMQGNFYISHLKANCCLLAHIAHKFALNDFALLYKRYPDNPLLAFLTGLCFIQLVCQKYSNKHLLFSQGIAFLSKYIENRGIECSQEIHYNIGRVFHQLNLLTHAAHHYELALKAKPAIDTDMYDLSKEIAYNLHLIYLNSGEVELARSFIEKYITV